MAKKLGKLESQFFAYVQLRGMTVVRTGELTVSLQITPKQERELLCRLGRAGIIAQVRRGLYLVPPRLPLGGKWTPDQALALKALMADKDGRYQICGPGAFNRYGFDDQVAARVYAYNNRLSGDRLIGAVAITLIKVADGRLGAVERVKTPGGQTAVYSSRVRTLVDAIYDCPRFAGLPRAYNWIRQELAAKRITADELARTAVRYGNQETLRRLGALLEAMGAGIGALGKLQKSVRPSTRLILAVPNRPRGGPVSRRWGVVLNG